MAFIPDKRYETLEDRKKTAALKIPYPKEVIEEIHQTAQHSDRRMHGGGLCSLIDGSRDEDLPTTPNGLVLDHRLHNSVRSNKFIHSYRKNDSKSMIL